MFRHNRRTLLACATAAAALLAPAVAQADVLNDWNVIAQNHAITLRPTAHGQTRGIAMVQGAVYDGVNAIDRGHQPYLLNVNAVAANHGHRRTRPSPRPPTACSSLVPPKRRVSTRPTQQHSTGSRTGRSKLEGVRAGEAAAAAMLAARENDGYFTQFDFSS